MGESGTLCELTGECTSFCCNGQSTEFFATVRSQLDYYLLLFMSLATSLESLTTQLDELQSSPGDDNAWEKANLAIYDVIVTHRGALSGPIGHEQSKESFAGSMQGVLESTVECLRDARDEELLVRKISRQYFSNVLILGLLGLVADTRNGLFLVNSDRTFPRDPNLYNVPNALLIPTLQSVATAMRTSPNLANPGADHGDLVLTPIQLSLSALTARAHEFACSVGGSVQNEAAAWHFDGTSFPATRYLSANASIPDWSHKSDMAEIKSGFVPAHIVNLAAHVAPGGLGVWPETFIVQMLVRQFLSKSKGDPQSGVVLAGAKLQKPEQPLHLVGSKSNAAITLCPQPPTSTTSSWPTVASMWQLSV